MKTPIAKPITSKTISEKTIGIGLRAPHFEHIINQQPNLDWLEIHSENFFEAKSIQRFYLDEIAQRYPLSFHGIGLSLGSTDPLNSQHLHQLRELIDAYQPDLISEHLSWSSFNGNYFNDLLPLPYTVEALDHFVDRVKAVQDYLGRNILIENPTTYLEFEQSTLSEWDFLAAIQHRSGCQLLLDLNNIYINSENLSYSTSEYLSNIPLQSVAEIHLAGFTRKQLDNGEILIDTHGSLVSDPVWALFEKLRTQCSAPALIEWDTDIPGFEVLLGEARKAHAIQTQLASKHALDLSTKTDGMKIA